MDKFYQENQESFNVDILAQLSLYFEKNTKELMFVCDWDDGKEGVQCIAEMVYQLKYGDIIERIIQSIYSQCVDNNRLHEFMQIKEELEKKYKAQQPVKSELVIRPREAK